MSEPIFAALEQKLEHGWDAFTSHLHPAHYHQPVTTATPATEAPMSMIQTVEHEGEAVLAHVEDFMRRTLPTAVADAKKIEPVLSSPLVDALLRVAHVPVGAIERLLIPSIDFLAEAFPKADVAQPVPADVTTGHADVAMGQQPEPAPAP
jgi:hypothetical protein